MMLPILGLGRGVGELARAREPARQLGLAFQLTNFIRDVREDLERGRIYLPLKDLAEFGVSPMDLRAGVTTDPIRKLIAFEVARAREHYARAADGIPMLAPSSQPCIHAAYRLRRHPRRVVRRYDVLNNGEGANSAGSRCGGKRVGPRRASGAATGGEGGNANRHGRTDQNSL
jgi:phytoene/squalene synthetase